MKHEAMKDEGLGFVALLGMEGMGGNAWRLLCGWLALLLLLHHGTCTPSALPAHRWGSARSLAAS